MKLSALQAEQFIQSEAIRIWNEYKTKYNCGEIPQIETYSNKTSTAGWAARSGKYVRFSIRFCMVDSQAYLGTIYHEFAHIIQFRLFPNEAQAHGPMFKAILLSMNADLSTYHSYNVQAAKSANVKEITLADLGF